VLAGYDDDLAAQSTRLTNRLHVALLHIHPALERLLGKHFDRGGVLELLAVAPTPATLHELGPDAITEVMRLRSPRLAKSRPAKILATLDAQTVVVPGTTDYTRVIAGVAAQLRDVHAERAALAADLEARLEAEAIDTIADGVAGRHPIAGLPDDLLALADEVALVGRTASGPECGFSTSTRGWSSSRRPLSAWPLSWRTGPATRGYTSPRSCAGGM
jgi:hypothetical protein